jgi:hypothetical protein
MRARRIDSLSTDYDAGLLSFVLRITQEYEVAARKISTEICPLDCDIVAYSFRRFGSRNAFIFMVELSKEA